MKKDMFFSVDTEYDGDVPSLNSMLSIGVVAMHHETQETIGTFYRVLKRLPGARPNASTMEWWDTELDAYKIARTDPVEPAEAMRDLDAWVRSLTPEDAAPVFVAYPLGADWIFTCFYLHMFVGSCVFGYAGVDMESVALGLLKATSYASMKKKNWPAEWQTVLPHTHKADDDALEQADIWRRMLRTLKGLPPLPVTGTRWLPQHSEQVVVVISVAGTSMVRWGWANKEGGGTTPADEFLCEFTREVTPPKPSGAFDIVAACSRGSKWVNKETGKTVTIATVNRGFAHVFFEPGSDLDGLPMNKFLAEYAFDQPGQTTKPTKELQST